MKEYLCRHRYLFGDEAEVDKPIQVGTKTFVDDFKKINESIPEVYVCLYLYINVSFFHLRRCNKH